MRIVSRVGTLGLLCLWTGCSAAGPSVKHVVLFKYKESATPEQIEAISAAFADLKHKIPGIIDFKSGVNNSPEGLNKGLGSASPLAVSSRAGGSSGVVSLRVRHTSRARSSTDKPSVSCVP